MTQQTSLQERRTFLKVSLLTGGGFLLRFDAFSGMPSHEHQLPHELSTSGLEMNAYIRIDLKNNITIMSPNPEGGQNVKTSMPMIVAEELDADWTHVMVEQADLDTKHFTRQFIGGSQAIRQGWQPLRKAGATARLMLMQAAAQQWGVPLNEITTAKSRIYHSQTGRSGTYGDFASIAAGLAVPQTVKLKTPEQFSIIGHSHKNVELKNIVGGKPLFGIDTTRKGMKIAMVIHPPAFGMKLKSFNDSSARKMKGIKDIFVVKSMQDDYEKQFFDTASFTEVIAIVGDSTWEVMQAKKSLQVEWQPFETYSEKRNMLGNKLVSQIPAGLESSSGHDSKLKERAKNSGTIRRKDGDPETAFKQAAKIIEKTYTGPFLAHNCMEPMNFFADVNEERAELIGPLQKPEYTEQTLATRLGMPLEKIDIKMTRLGGGYGRRSYAHWMLEAAVISQKMKCPVKLIYSREDDMTSGIYRSAYTATFRAALDANNDMIAFHVNAGGVPESPLFPNRFPAGAVENYLAEDWTLPSNISVGSFRAPRSNFMAAAEQCFIDEVAEAAGKDPLAFRIALLKKAIDSPVGKNNEYEPKRFLDVLELLREKSGWDNRNQKEHLGVSAYFCHDSYVATVFNVEVNDEKIKVKDVCCAIDCGILINPDAARNMAEGGIVDGIGTALFGEMTFTDGVPDKNNFDRYRMIRMREAPQKIDIHFVKNNIDPTGMGEPTYPPVFAALANAMYKATGQRQYRQPFRIS